MLRLRNYERLLVENRRFRFNGGRLTQNFRSPTTNHSSSQKTKLNYLSYSVKMWRDLSSVLSQCTRVTGRRTEFSSLYRVCITCSAVKNLPMPHSRSSLFQHIVVDWIELEQGLTFHQTHYKSHWGQVFTGQMTQPTVSKH